MLTSDYCGSFDGILIHYTVNRRPKNPTLLFIHGAGSNSTVWSKITKQLGDKSYLAVDLRNHGLSGFGKLSLETATRDVAEVVVRENLKQFIPVGMSVGAPIAVELAKKFPDKVPKIILISPTSRTLSRCSLFLAGIASSIKILCSSFPRRKKLKLVNYEKLIHISSFLKPFQEIKGIHMRDYTGLIEQSMMAEIDFGHVKKPIMIITGSRDILIRRKQIKKIMKRYPNIAHCELPTDHLVLRGQPLRTARLINMFTGE